MQEVGASLYQNTANQGQPQDQGQPGSTQPGAETKDKKDDEEVIEGTVE